MAHIRRHPKTNKWQVRYTHQWRIERSETFDRKKDANDFKAEVEVAVNRGVFLDPVRGQVSLKTWCRSWLDGRVGVRPSTRARDESYLTNYIIGPLGRLRLSDITFEHVQLWVRQLETKGLAPATIRKAHQLLGQILERAVRARRSPGTQRAAWSCPAVPTVRRFRR